MSIQPDKPLLEALRFALKNLEADLTPETPSRADLKRILRERMPNLKHWSEGRISSNYRFSPHEPYELLSWLPQPQ